MEERLAAELIDAVNSRGAAVKKREDTHKWLTRIRRLVIIDGKNAEQRA